MTGETSHKRTIVFFDGVCNLCNSSIQYIIKHDPDRYFFFAPLQSEIAKKILGYNLNKYDSIILFEEEKIYFKSTAALKIAKKLNGLNKLLYPFIFLPKSLRDLIYDFIAKRRYKWFGKKQYCMIPTPDLKSRFL